MDEHGVDTVVGLHMALILEMTLYQGETSWPVIRRICLFHGV